MGGLTLGIVGLRLLPWDGCGRPYNAKSVVVAVGTHNGIPVNQYIGVSARFFSRSPVKRYIFRGSRVVKSEINRDGSDCTGNMTQCHPQLYRLPVSVSVSAERSGRNKGRKNPEVRVLCRPFAGTRRATAVTSSAARAIQLAPSTRPAPRGRRSRQTVSFAFVQHPSPSGETCTNDMPAWEGDVQLPSACKVAAGDFA